MSSFALTPGILANANLNAREVNLLASLLPAVVPNILPQRAQEILKGHHAEWSSLCEKIERSGSILPESNPLRRISGTWSLLLSPTEREALILTLTLCLGVPGEVGLAAAQGLLTGISQASGVSPVLGLDDSCMSIDMIRALIVDTHAAQVAAAEVRGGQVSQRPLFCVTPPGAGFGEWFGAQKFSGDASKDPKYPQQALQEWGRYVDELSKVADVFVMPYVAAKDSSLWRMVYTANGPQIFEIDGELFALLPNLSHLGRQSEARWFRDFLVELGIPIENIIQPPYFQEGQADVSRPIPRPGKEPLLFVGYGVRTPLEEVYNYLRKVTIKKTVDGNPVTREIDLFEGYQVEPIRMNPDSYAFHQDTWLNVITNPQGELYALYCPEWIHPDDRERMAKILEDNNLKPIVINNDDAKAYAANANEVDGTVFTVRGKEYALSDELNDRLRSFGFNLIELTINELYGKAGGGTRCMVNELLRLIRDRSRHAELMARLEFFRYVPGSWQKIQHVYPAVYVGSDNRFVRG